MCVVARVDDATRELKNIATYPQYQGQGYGKALVAHILEHYKDKCRTMLVGTGDVPRMLAFYERCGFKISHRLKNFFTDNYAQPIFEGKIQLIDMVYLKKDF